MTTPHRRRADRGHGAALRGELLTAAEELLVEAGGEQAVTVRAVATRVGVSTPSVYLHFADRAELVDAVCLGVWDALAAETDRAAAQTEDPFGQLRLRGLAYVRFAQTHPVQYQLLMMRPADGQPLREEAGRAAYSLLRDCVDRCVETGALRGDPHRLAVGLLAAVHGIAALLIAQPLLVGDDPAVVEAIVGHCVRVAGLGNALAGRLGEQPRLIPSAVAGPALDRLAEELLGASEPMPEPTPHVTTEETP